MAFALLAVTLTAIAAATGCASSPHSLGATNDRALSDRANGALSAAGFDARRVEVRCYRGVATLLGDAGEPEARQAERIVESVPGIVRVNNLVFNESSSTDAGSARSEKAPILARAATAASAEK